MDRSLIVPNKHNTKLNWFIIGGDCEADIQDIYIGGSVIFMNDFDRYGFLSKLPAILPIRKTEHFNIYYYSDSYAEKEIEYITIQREKAYENICMFLNIVADIHIDLYLFNDAETKEAETGHRGTGWAFDNVMVEIYNETVKCHPYHELVHVIATKTLGFTVSFINEGLAVYISNYYLNTDFGDYINHNIHEKVAHSYTENELFPLNELFSLQIGESVSRSPISYPESGSIVEYLINSLGMEKFIMLYKVLQCNYSSESIAANIQEFEKLCEKPVEKINKEWLNTIKYT